MTATHTQETERAAFANVARLFGDLLLRELTAEQVERLSEPELADALGALGVAAPIGLDDSALDGAALDDRALDELSAEFHACFLAPDRGGAPLVASLWREGRYEGDLARRVRELAESAALEFDRSAAIGAPVDHLGVLLHLWAAASERAPWVAEEIGRDHLAWAEAPLGRIAGGQHSVFYASVAKGALELVRVLRDESQK